MKMKYLLEQLRGRDGETTAVFGAARLVKHLDGKIQLLGGTPDDRRAARDLSRFGSGERHLPEAKAQRAGRAGASGSMVFDVPARGGGCLRGLN